MIYYPAPMAILGLVYIYAWAIVFLKKAHYQIYKKSEVIKK